MPNTEVLFTSERNTSDLELSAAVIAFHQFSPPVVGGNDLFNNREGAAGEYVQSDWFDLLTPDEWEIRNL